ncbi:sensitive to high expression protein 9 [Agrocybe pediades]|nr:sensitive to high expression protein 9 [Agrocybe pediades]
MLRSSLSRTPRLLRHFSSTPHIRYLERVVENNAQDKESPPNSTNVENTLGGSSRPLLGEPLKAELHLGAPVATPETKQTASDNDTRQPVSAYDLELVKKRIREWAEQATIALRHRADDFTAATKTTFSQLGSELNRVTGYEEIEALKKGVVEQEERISVARQAAREAKVAYEHAMVQRANSQREVNDLLARKNNWIESDIARFTNLVKQDHLREQEEARAKMAVDETEAAAEKEFSQLMRLILARYHEEQVWSDKIRSASTYGSMAALALNMLVFIMAIVVVEPWKRKRLAQTFERKIEELSNENEARLGASMQSISQQLAQQEKLIEALKVEALKEVSGLREASTQVVLPTPREAEPRDVVMERKAETLLETLSRTQWEVAALGAGAFVAGILSTILLSR